MLTNGGWGCGYEGHYCRAGVVRFISRYRGENDYCVGGRRITLREDGSSNATETEAPLLAAFIRAERQSYEAWHYEQSWTEGEPEPIEAAQGIFLQSVAS